MIRAGVALEIELENLYFTVRSTPASHAKPSRAGVSCRNTAWCMRLQTHTLPYEARLPEGPALRGTWKSILTAKLRHSCLSRAFFCIQKAQPAVCAFSFLLQVIIASKLSFRFPDVGLYEKRFLRQPPTQAIQNFNPSSPAFPTPGRSLPPFPLLFREARRFRP